MVLNIEFKLLDNKLPCEHDFGLYVDLHGLFS